LNQDLESILDFFTRYMRREEREDDMFSLDTGLDLGFPVWGLAAFVGCVEILGKE